MQRVSLWFLTSLVISYCTGEPNLSTNGMACSNSACMSTNQRDPATPWETNQEKECFGCVEDLTNQRSPATPSQTNQGKDCFGCVEDLTNQRGPATPWETNQGKDCFGCIEDLTNYRKFTFDNSPGHVKEDTARVSPISSSSWSLSEKQVETMSDIVHDLEDYPKLLENGPKNAILTSDLYKGKKTLVYKLAPGAIFQGVKRDRLHQPARSINTKNQNLVHKDNLIDSDSDVSEHGTFGNYQNKDQIKPRLKHNRNPSKIKWKVHYVQPPPLLSSMDNPYLPPKTKQGDRPKLLRVLNQNNHLFPHPPPGSNLFMYPLAKMMQLARMKTRGVRISFLLMHYLGFIPFVPGIPRHKDPKHVMTGIMHVAG